MKKAYSKPVVEVEAYTLTESFALGCEHIATFGPGFSDVHKACSDYDNGEFDVQNMVRSANRGTNFYKDGIGGCTCYTTSGGGSYFTS